MTTEEMFDVLDQWGCPTGEVLPKSEVHLRGLWHAGMHLAVTDGRGNLYQQLRGGPPYVKILADVWDLFLVTGHVSAGETPLDTLLRESEEETGRRFTRQELDANGLRMVGIVPTEMWVADASMPDGGYWHRVFDYNFVVRLDLELGTLRLEPNKVIQVRRYPIVGLAGDLVINGATAKQHAYRPPNNSSLYGAVLAGLRDLNGRNW